MSINDIMPGEIGVFQAMIASGPVIIRETRDDDDILFEVLLVKHGTKPIDQLKWKFPGGKVIKGQDFKDVAIMEAEQEIGVKIHKRNLKQPLCPMILWNETPESGAIQPEAIILIHYLAEIYEPPVAGPEIVAMEWFDIDHLPADCSPNIEPVIKDFRAWAKKD